MLTPAAAAGLVSALLITFAGRAGAWDAGVEMPANEPTRGASVSRIVGGGPQATISVDTLLDIVAEDGDCSLREAILNAEGNDQSGSTDCAPGAGSPDEIVFDASIAGGTIVLNGEALPTITEALHITGPVADEPAGMTLDADGMSRILFVDTADGVTVELSRLTLTGGRITAGGGGGIFSSSDLSLTHVALIGNATEGDNGFGGGLAAIGGDITLTDSIVSDNSTAGASSSGGGLFVEEGSMTLIRTKVLDNTTAGTGATGGGLAKLGFVGSVTLTDCVVSGNRTLAAGARGGGLFAATSFNHTVRIERSTVSGNSAGGGGGGLDLNTGESGIDSMVVNSTVSGNISGGNGGGMFTTGDTAVHHSTFAFNTAAVDGDGIYRHFVPVILENSLVVQGGDGEVACNTSMNGTTGSLATDGSCGAEVATLQEIALMELADNGGPTPTHALDTGSVAIDQADDAICGELAPQEDQRGVPRPLDGDGDGSGEDLDGGCDVGAYEAAPVQEPVLAFVPASLDFGDVAVGDSAESTTTLQNAGGADATGLDFSGLPDMGFEADTDGCGSTLPAGESCTVVVTFTPAQPGTAGATLQVGSAEDASATLSLAGNGVFPGGFTAWALEVDPVGLAPGANGVFEPGESVDVAPAWRNDNTMSEDLSGTASDFTGPAGAIYTLAQGGADYGTVGPGQSASCLDTGTCYVMGVNDPARPATHWDATFDETLDDPGGTARTWTVHIGDSFTDVPRDSLFYSWIETLLHSGVTGGCIDTGYCPGGTSTRGQMPVFVLRALLGPEFTPEPCVERDERFDDVPAGHLFCPWIEELAARGVVAGCGGNDYCPGDPVTRAQMAIFLLRTLEGADFTPPDCEGVFADVTCPSIFADWVEELFHRGVTEGCGEAPLRYCPGAANTRSQMAVFLSKTFGLTLYGP